jgi:hypothetical protein
MEEVDTESVKNVHPLHGVCTRSKCQRAIAIPRWTGDDCVLPAGRLGEVGAYCTTEVATRYIFIFCSEECAKLWQEGM